MASTVQKIDKFHGTHRGKFAFAVTELALAVGLSMWAIDSGAIWQYVLAIIFYVGGLNNLVSALKNVNHRNGNRNFKIN